MSGGRCISRRDEPTYNRSVPKKTATKPSDETNATKSARTRERILDAAAHVLSRKGFAGTRLSDVAVQAELQAPAIYYYFSSREDLIEEVMWAGLARMHEHLQAALDALPAGPGPWTPRWPGAARL